MLQEARQLAQVAIAFMAAGHPLAERLLAQVEAIVRLAITCDKGYHDEKTRRELEVRLETLRCFLRLGIEGRALTSEMGERWIALCDEIGGKTGESPPGAAFPFEAVASLDDRSIQRVLREIDSRELALALKGSSEAVKAAVFHNMSQRMGKMIRDELDYMGPVREKDVLEVQHKIGGVILGLEQRGEIVIARDGERLVD